MARTVEISGKSLVYLFYLVSVAAFVPLSGLVVWPVDSVPGLALGVLCASVALALVVGLWRTLTGEESASLGTAADIAYDPIADPGQAAKHRWTKAVRRVPGRRDDAD